MNYEGSMFENRINITFTEGQLLCAICTRPWLNNSPRCLPCEISHIFCSECIEEYGRINLLEEGSTFSCPVCRAKHYWPRKGVQSFILLTPFVDCCTTSFANEESESTSHFQQKTAHKTKSNTNEKDIQDIQELRIKISKTLEQLEKRRDIEWKLLDDEIKNITQLIEQRRLILRDQLNIFYKEKESKLRDLLNDAKILQSFRITASDRFKKCYEEMRQRLFKETIEIFNSYAVFSKSYDKSALNLGEIIKNSMDI
ncbi:unnamed protein product [Dimorphilus gyrociliatus]|uniref:RING-type domain-containing protein n=1 Tax=Dimorphilus gyrociliatus TaxID=2664684 RepID=A0A7I8VB10_9ANNE|nr:unnamed protein product [Dimorphilus gyrociliatus]